MVFHLFLLERQLQAWRSGIHKILNLDDPVLCFSRAFITFKLDQFFIGQVFIDPWNLNDHIG